MIDRLALSARCGPGLTLKWVLCGAASPCLRGQFRLLNTLERINRGLFVTIELSSLEDRLFVKLRVATAQRLCAAGRGDDGLCVLLARQRSLSLDELRMCSSSAPLRILHAA